MAWPEAFRAGIAAVPAEVAAGIGQASSEAFVAGMDRAFVLSSIVIVVFGALAFVLIKDNVAAARRSPATAAEATLVAEGAD